MFLLSFAERLPRHINFSSVSLWSVEFGYWLSWMGAYFQTFMIPKFLAISHLEMTETDMVVAFSRMFYSDLLLNYFLFIHLLNCLQVILSNQHRKKTWPSWILMKLGSYIVSLETFTHSSFSIICCMASWLEPAKKSIFSQILAYTLVLNRP